jgi:DNA polymerase I-like protein with 3'-5' exonuclease and polymerase domains
MSANSLTLNVTWRRQATMIKNQRTETIIGRDCDLCNKSGAWPDETCTSCPSYKEDHYAEGIGPLRNCDYFCVAESPTLSPVSRTINGHSCWDTDAERVIYHTFKTIQEKNGGMRTFAGDFTYAVRCTIDKPSAKHLKACQHFLRARILERAVKDRPIMVFAMGITVLKALGISAKKYGDYQGNYTEIELSGRKVVVYGGLSKRQIDAKAGFSEVAAQQVELFLKAVQNNVEGKTLQCTKTTAEITRNYIFPKTLQEVSDTIDHIIGFHIPQNTSPEKHSISIDTETNTKYPHREKLKLLTVIVSWGYGKATSIPVEHPESTWSLEDVRPMLNKLFMCPKPKIFQNAKFDLKVLWRKGFEVNNIYWDTMLGEHLLAEDKKGFYGLKEIVKLDVPEFANYEDELHRILNKDKKTKEIKAAEAEDSGAPKIKGIAKLLIEDDGFINIGLDLLNSYGAIDGEATWRIRPMQMKRMRREDVKLYEARIEARKSPQPLVKAGAIPHCDTQTPLENIMKTRTIPTMRVLARMELHGMPVDREYALELATKMDSSLILSHIELNSMLISGTKDALNPESSQQIAAILYSRGYVHPETKECVCYNGRVEPPRTDTGQISTNASFLRRLVTEHNCAFCAALLRHRAIKKARNTFVENILVLSAEDGRMHSNFHQHGTSSGRLCVSENTQLDTDNGTFKISNLDLSKVPKVSIRTHTGEWRAIEAVYYKGKEEMYRVELENGNSIEVTENHRFYTDKGFQHLKNLTYGSEVITYTADTVNRTVRGNRYRRGDVCAPLLRRKVIRSSVFGFGSVVQNTQQFCSGIQRKVCHTDTREKVPQLLSCVKGKYSRYKSPTRGRYPARETTGMCRQRVHLLHDCQSTKCQCVVRASEYAGIRYDARKKADLQNTRYRYGTAARFRAVRSRVNENGNAVLPGPARLLQKAVRSIFPCHRADLVYKRTGPELQSVQRTWASPCRQYMLELKQARDAAIYGVNGLKNTTYTPGSLLQKLPRRLWVSRSQTSSRNRRELPRTSRYHEKRYIQAERSGTLGVQNTSFHNEGGRGKAPTRYNTNMFGVSRIIKVTPIGVMGVWDIQVAVDHSYVAHGFVNHNSSSQENMQNIPKKIGGHNIKRMFVPTDSETFAIVNTDAKAAEVRIYAAYSHDKNLIDALNKGMDPHSFFASIVYNPANVLSGVSPGDKHKVLSTVGIDENHAWNYNDFCVRDSSEESNDRAYGIMLDKLRTIVKRVVFGILYGAAKKKIASIVGIPDEQAQIVIDTLFKMFPSIPNYIAITQQQLRSFGMVETFIGRRRRFDLKKLTSWQRSRAERQSINFKIQSTSSDIVMDVMASVDDAIRGDFGGQLMNTVHDSLVMQIPKKYLHQIPDFIQKHGVDAVAKKYPWLPVPFQWDVEMGPSYGELISARKYLDTMDTLQVIEVEEDFMECDIRNELEEAILEEALSKAI